MRRFAAALLALALAACAPGDYRAPVETREALVTGVKRPPTHKVAAGDTLYAIAFRYGMDYRLLAEYNGIGADYRIYPGQLIKLHGDPVVLPATGRRGAAQGGAGNGAAGQGGAADSWEGSAAAVKGATGGKDRTPAAGSAKAAAGGVGGATAAGDAAAKGGAASGADRTSAATGGASGGKNTVAAGGAKKPIPPLPGGWRWPASGKVIRGFSNTVHQGIDIAGKTGDPVAAAADGIIVYAGSAIAGYGKLLIVKHSEAYLSAYGHNARLLVKEGDAVRAGQTIAEKGSTAANSVRLHFEIRQEGTPINPTQFLPPR